jgi:tetratricopeptide (TPR) repeat protein
MMNLRYFLFPSGLHGFILGYPGSFLDWRALAGFACLGSYGVLLWKYRRNRILVFGATSFLIALFPILNLVKTSAVTLISMRWLYFPTSLLLLAFLDMIEDALTRVRPADALACLNRARSLNMTRHERAELYNNLGIALLSLHRDADAIENLRKAVLFAPEEPLFWANLGAAYGRMEDYENSVFALKKGLDILIDPMPLKTDLAISYIRMQEFRKAIEILESVPVQERKNNDMISRLLLEAREGVSLKEGGKTKQAEEGALVQEGSSTVERQK